MQPDHDLVHAIYDTVFHPQTMPEVLQGISDRIGAFGAMIFDCQISGNHQTIGLQFASTAWDVDSVMHYIGKYNQEEIDDQGQFAALSLPGNHVNLIPESKLFTKSRMPGKNVSFMKSVGISNRYGALLSKEVMNTNRFAFQFAQSTPLPSEEALAWAEDTLRHLAKSLSIGRGFNQTKLVQAGFETVVKNSPIATAIVGSNNQILFANSEMERLFQDRPQISKTTNGKIGFHDQGADTAIQHLLTSSDAHGLCATRPRLESVFLAGRNEQERLFVEICPISDHPDLGSFSEGARVISIIDGEICKRIDTKAVQRYFPLSKTEFAVFDLLIEGRSNTEIAEIRSRSVETVNSQVKAVLRKMSARNRIELVKIAVSLSFGMAPRISD